ncbi:MAG TPA: PilZ domain-containing protein [Planctomycetota bacterium]|nr:PilZ domain-containing protein [Planctomycetota bacterium]
MELTIEPRRTGAIRLTVEKGVVFLREAGMASLACTLNELGESSCLCSASLGALHPELVRIWKLRLTAGREMPIDISSPPHLPALHLRARLQRVRASEAEVQLELEFLEIDQHESTVLGTALLALGGTKLAVRTAAMSLPAVLPRTTHDPYRGQRLGDVLVALGKLTREQADCAELASRKVKERIGHYLLRRCLITPMELCGALSLQSGLNIVDLQGRNIPRPLFSIFSYLTMLKHHFVPFEDTGHAISIAASSPLSAAAVKELETRCGRRIQQFLAEEDAIVKHLYSLHPDRARRHRKNTRYELQVPVAFQICNRRLQTFEDEQIEGRTVNVSETGLCIATSHDLARHDAAVRVRFSFYQRSAEGIYAVRYIKPVQAGYHVGLDLVDVEPEHAASLKEICIQVGLLGAKNRSHRKICSGVY